MVRVMWTSRKQDYLETFPLLTPLSQLVFVGDISHRFNSYCCASIFMPMTTRYDIAKVFRLCRDTREELKVVSLMDTTRLLVLNLRSLKLLMRKWKSYKQNTFHSKFLTFFSVSPLTGGWFGAKSQLVNEVLCVKKQRWNYLEFYFDFTT